jgi:prevent-host-death family protein
MQTVSVAHAKAHLSALLDAVSSGGEVLITRHGRPVAKIAPAHDAKPDLSIFDAHKGSLPKKFKFVRDQLNERIR